MCIVADGLDPFGTELDWMTCVVYGDPAPTLTSGGPGRCPRWPGAALESHVSVRDDVRLRGAD